MKRFLPILLLLPLLAGCGSFQNLSETIAEGRRIAGEIRETVEDIKPVIEKIVEESKEYAELYEDMKGSVEDLSGELKEMNREAFEKADKDGDGELSILELITYITLLGGGSLALGRKKIAAALAVVKEKQAQQEQEKQS